MLGRWGGGSRKGGGDLRNGVRRDGEGGGTRKGERQTSVGQM